MGFLRVRCVVFDLHIFARHPIFCLVPGMTWQHKMEAQHICVEFSYFFPGDKAQAPADLSTGTHCPSPSPNPLKRPNPPPALMTSPTHHSTPSSSLIKAGPVPGWSLHTGTNSVRPRVGFHSWEKEVPNQEWGVRIRNERLREPRAIAPTGGRLGDPRWRGGGAGRAETAVRSSSQTPFLRSRGPC